MRRDLKNGKNLKENWTADSKELQKSSQEKISPDDLPFDLGAELGEVVAAELRSPGVYYIGIKQEGDVPNLSELYAVTAEAPAISEKARSYGQEFPGHPGLRIYNIHQPGSGRHIIDYAYRL